MESRYIKYNQSPKSKWNPIQVFFSLAMQADLQFGFDYPYQQALYRQ